MVNTVVVDKFVRLTASGTRFWSAAWLYGYSRQPLETDDTTASSNTLLTPTVIESINNKRKGPILEPYEQPTKEPSSLTLPVLFFPPFVYLSGLANKDTPRLEHRTNTVMKYSASFSNTGEVIVDLGNKIQFHITTAACVCTP